MSGILGLVVPGLGQLYNGKSRHFMIFIAVMFAGDAAEYTFDLTHTFKGMIAYVIFSIVLMLLSVILSIITGIRNRYIEKKVYHQWYVYAVIFISLSGIILVHSPFDSLHSYYIPTGSMAPTIMIGDKIISGKTATGIRRGDIVVFRPPVGETDKDYIKRCVALPGDILSIRDGAVYLNGKRLNESYVRGTTSYAGFSDKDIIEGTVPRDSYVMLGDNREHSLDSRYFGYVPRDRIMGKVLYIWYSRNSDKIGTEF